MLWRGNFFCVALTFKRALLIETYKSCPILLDFFILFQYFVQDCLRKEIFGGTSAQSPSNVISLAFAVILGHFSNLWLNRSFCSLSGFVHNLLVQVQFPTSKTNFDIQYSKLGIRAAKLWKFRKINKILNLGVGIA